MIVDKRQSSSGDRQVPEMTVLLKNGPAELWRDSPGRNDVDA